VPSFGRKTAESEEVFEPPRFTTAAGGGGEGARSLHEI
jgi:hypothetical protein